MQNPGLLTTRSPLPSSKVYWKSVVHRVYPGMSCDNSWRFSGQLYHTSSHRWWSNLGFASSESLHHAKLKCKHHWKLTLYSLNNSFTQKLVYKLLIQQPISMGHGHVETWVTLRMISWPLVTGNNKKLTTSQYIKESTLRFDTT